jgi:hypothetical protein
VRPTSERVATHTGSIRGAIAPRFEQPQLLVLEMRAPCANASATGFAGVSDPVASGLVTSLARPGGNVTGISLLAPDREST